MGPFDDLIPAQNRSRAAPPMLGQSQPLAGLPRMPTPQTGAQQQIDAGHAAASAYDRDIAAANARKAEAEATTAQANAAAGHQTTEAAQQLAGRRANINAASTQLLDVARQYHGSFQGGNVLQSIRESLPDFMSPTNSTFDAASAGLSEASLAALRVPGVGSQSDTELQQFVRSNQPDAQAFDGTNEQRLDNVQNRLNAHRHELGLPPIDWRAAVRQDADVPPTAGAAPPAGATQPPAPARGNTQDPQSHVGTGETNMQVDPVMRGIGNRLSRMLASPSVSDTAILNYLRSVGVDPATTNVETGLQTRRTPGFRRWQQANPGAGYPIGPAFFTRDVPQSLPNRVLSSAANSGLGNYFAQAGQAVTGNHIDDMVGWTGGNQEQANAGINQLREDRPFSSIAGDLTGTALAYGVGDGAMAGAGRLAAPILNGGGRAAAMASRFINPARGYSTFAPRAVAGDLAYGAYQGSGDNDGTILGDMLASGAGGMAGRGLARGTGHALRGVQNLDVRRLTGQNVPLTVGQMLRPAQAVIPRAVSGIEDRLSGLPIVGDVINAARYRGQEGFNRAAINRSVRGIPGDVTATGADGIGQAQRHTSNAYTRALSGVQVAQDQPFTQEWGAVRATGGAIPNRGDEFNHTMGEIDNLFENGQMSGTNFQAARQILREERAGATGPLSRPLRQAYTQAEDALTGMVNRQAPQAVPLLRAADRAYRRTSIVGDAVLAARSRPDELFTPAQLGTADVSSTVKFGGRNAARRGSTPFYPLRSAGSNVLGNMIPDSGTAGRSMLYGLGGMAAGGAGIGGADGASGGGGASGALSGAGSGIEDALALAAVLYAPHSKAGQRAIQDLLVRRPDLLRQAGAALQNSPASRGAGGAGAGLGSLFGAPMLNGQ